MKNIGSVAREWLAEIEVYSNDDLCRVGATSAWVQIKALYPEFVTTKLLWALVGAELNMDWRKLPSEVKETVLAEVNGSVG
jgi:DNA transformation protein